MHLHIRRGSFQCCPLVLVREATAKIDGVLGIVEQDTCGQPMLPPSQLETFLRYYCSVPSSTMKLAN